MPITKTHAKVAVDFDLMAQEYASLRDTRDAIIERLKAIQEAVGASMGDEAKKVTQHGTWHKTLSNRFSWSLNAIKKLYGRDWVKVVSPDTSLLTFTMKEGKDKRLSASLRKIAEVSVSESIKLL